MSPAPLALLLLASCSWIGGQELLDRQDFDRDGHIDAAFGGDDCDDADAAVNPGEPERCDAVDHDCDGTDGLQDDDGDGFLRCEDCADADASIRPDAEERCDLVDNDCDGLVDDEDPSVLGQILQRPDADGDGHGDEDGSPTESCARLPGQAASDDDCDDGDPGIPASRDRCGNSADDDCDGQVDPCEPWAMDDGDAVVNGPPYSSKFGLFYDLRHDLDGDGLDDLLITAPTEGGDARYISLLPGPVHVGADISAGARAIITYTGLDAFGTSVALGEWTGDGVLDAAVGGVNPLRPDKVWVFSGPLVDLTADADTAFWTTAAADWDAGRTVVAVDLDGDGLDSLAVAAPESPNGAVYLIIDPTTPPGLLEGADFAITGVGSGDGAGTGLDAVGDTDGDGHADLLIGAPAANDGDGAAAVLRGDDLAGGSSLVLTDLSSYYLGTSSLTGFGRLVSDAGDLDGDGLADLALSNPLLGTESNIRRGWIYVTKGNESSGGEYAGVSAFSKLNTPEGFTLTSVDAAGDFDGDGQDDLVAVALDEVSEGRVVWLVYGPLQAGVDLGQLSNPLSATNGETFIGEIGGKAYDPMCGCSPHVAGGGDLDGDGRDDLVLSAGIAVEQYAVSVFHGF